MVTIKDDTLVQESLSDEEKAAKILEAELPRLCNDIAMLVRRPFRFIWDPSQETACTDCVAEIRVAPWPFIEGRRQVGYGMVYHESGHILWSPYGAQTLTRAQQQGGPSLNYIVNLILDRKDDILTMREAEGFVEDIRRRLPYLCTLHLRLLNKSRIAGKDDAEQLRFLSRIRPKDLYEDFFYACKWHRRPRFKDVRRAMRVIRNRKLLNAGPDQLLWMARRIREILGPMPKDQLPPEDASRLHFFLASQGIKLSPALAKAIKRVIQNFVSSCRKQALSQMIKLIKSGGHIHPGPISTGVKEGAVPVKKMPPDPQHAEENQRLLKEMESQIAELIRRLKQIDNPSEFTLYGQEEGELDLDESARIATGLGGIYKETILERDIDAEIHLAVDCSGSMSGQKLKDAKKVALVFSRAIEALHPVCTGRIWAFSSRAIYDFGEPHPNSALVTMEGEEANSDTHMLSLAGRTLSRSTKRRRVLIVLGDDGPDNIEEAGRLSRLLAARGIAVIHVLVGVHGTPDIYPVEILYTSMEECLSEIGDLLETIIKNLR